MLYLWTSGNEIKIHELGDSFIRDIKGESLRSMYDAANCAYSFDYCIAAAFVASCIIVNTPELYDLGDEFKMALQRAAAIYAMTETNTEDGYSRKDKLSQMTTDTHEPLVRAILFQSESLNVLHESKLSLVDVAHDANKIAILLLPEPRMHVLNAGAWAVLKHQVEMSALTLKTYAANDLYSIFHPAWIEAIAGNKPYVHPTTLKILEQQEIIAKATAEIVKISDACSHDTAITVHDGDTGNWSQSDDSYSKKVTCTICGRHWYWNQNHGERDYTLLSTSQHQLPIKP